MKLKKLYNFFTFSGKYNALQSLIYGFGFGSLSFILICLNALGKHDIAISIGLIQSGIYLITIGLSGNFRSLALADVFPAKNLLAVRFVISIICLVLAPVILFALNFDYKFILFLLVFRKFLDWIDELCILENFKKKSLKNNFYFFIQLSFLIYFPFINFKNTLLVILYLTFWNISTILLFFKNYLQNIKFVNFSFPSSFNHIFHNSLLPVFIATFIPSLVNNFFRIRIFKIFDIQTASKLISTFALAGTITSFLIFVIIPDFIKQIKDKNNKLNIIYKWILYVLLIYLFICFVSHFFRANIEALNISYKIFLLAIISGFFYLLSNGMKTYQIQKYQISCLGEEYSINFAILSMILFSPASNVLNYFAFIPIIGAFFSLLIYDINRSYLDTSHNRFKVIYLILFLILLFFATFLSASHHISANLGNLNIKIYSLLVLLLGIILFNGIVKRGASEKQSNYLDLFFVLIWFLFNAKYLNTIIIDYRVTLFFLIASLAFHLYLKICQFINLRFLYYPIKFYIMFLAIYLAF